MQILTIILSDSNKFNISAVLLSLYFYHKIQFFFKIQYIALPYITNLILIYSSLSKLIHLSLKLLHNREKKRKIFEQNSERNTDHTNFILAICGWTRCSG